MSRELQIGTIVKSSFGREWTVKEVLGSGGQGIVYLVEDDIEEKALKWYWSNPRNQELYEHIKKSVIDGSPTDQFIWPQDTTEYEDGSFGYIMDLKPDGFYDMTDFLLKTVAFPSFRRAIDACMNIVSNMRILHNKGYSYQDLNDGNFFISPELGRVMICDNDNVAPNGVSMGVYGKPRYMAPEIVQRKELPNIYSDRFSMALIIFRLLTLNHPLEGKKSIQYTLTPELQMEMYGTNPVFMFDPDDDSNRPDNKEHYNAINVWSCLPEYMRDIFIEAFGKDSLRYPNRRPTEVEWLDSLVRFRSNIVNCECGNEVFLNDDGATVCEKCNDEIKLHCMIELPEYSIPGERDSRLYKCQTCITDADQSLEPVARVISSKADKSILGIRNMSDDTWVAYTTKGKKRMVAPKEVIPLKSGIRFNCNGTDILIK